MPTIKESPSNATSVELFTLQAFVELQTKTQVMGTGEGDFHRTRLTHTLEVGQIGRGIVWNLSRRDNRSLFVEWLPPTELIEAICYAHDLGHPPYGHAGERALHLKMRGHGGFEGNAQTLRVLTHQEKYYKGQGIRPTRRLLLGVLKYPVAYSEYGNLESRQKPPKCFYTEDIGLVTRLLEPFGTKDCEEFRKLGASDKPKYKSFDCSIMELADDIAYGVHDLEDGIGRGVLRRDRIESKLKSGFKSAGVKRIRDVTIAQLLKKLFSVDACERKHGISLLVGYFIVAINVRKREIFTCPVLDLEAYVPSEQRQVLDHLSKEITYAGVVNRREVQTLEFKGQKIVSDLFAAFEDKPLELIGGAQLDPFRSGVEKILKSAEVKRVHWTKLPVADQLVVYRAIADFIAGMTNPYAEKYHRRLFEPGYGSSTDEM